MTNHSSILAWRTAWTEEPDWLQSMGSQRVRYNESDTTVHAHTHPFLKHAWEHERVEGEIGTAVAGWHRPSVESSQVQSCETNIWITEFSPRGGHRRSARSTDLSDVHSIYLQSLDLRLCFEVLGINYFLKRPSSSL